MVAAGQIGALFGRGIESSSHLLPLVIVALCVDAWSVFSSQGVTHALVVDGEVPSAYPFLLFSMPVPGVGISPVLGIADLLFTSLMLAAFRQLGFGLLRPVLGIMVGFSLCLTTVLWTALPIPALVFIGPCPLIAMGRRIKSRWTDVGIAFGFVFVLIGTISLLS